MALGEYSLLSWKSKSQQKEEEEKYEQWAFPYGQEQRDKLVKLMLEVFPKESQATVLIPFLTCKELYSKLCKTPDLADYAINKLLVEIKKYKRIITKKNMPTYVALVVADSRIDSKIEYPSADQIISMAQGFIVTKT